MFPVTFTIRNLHPPALPPLSHFVISGVQRLLGTHYAPLNIRMDLTLPVLPPKNSGVLCHLFVSPPHYLAAEVVEEALDVLRQKHVLKEADLLLFFIRGPRGDGSL